MLTSLVAERFPNSRGLFNAAEGSIFLGKIPLDNDGFGLRQLGNRCSLSNKIREQWPGGFLQ